MRVDGDGDGDGDAGAGFAPVAVTGKDDTHTMHTHTYSGTLFVAGNTMTGRVQPLSSTFRSTMKLYRSRVHIFTIAPYTYCTQLKA